jgi:hypothetical protein
MDTYSHHLARTLLVVNAALIAILFATPALATTPTPLPPTPTSTPALCVEPFTSPGDVCCASCSNTHTCVTAQGGSGCFDVAAPDDCCWSAQSSSNELTLTSGAQGCGDGQVCYQVASYIGDFGRVLDVNVGDEVYRVGQSRPGTITPTNTLTATPTPAVTNTPTCAATGTPYCATQCVPCPTIRAGCFARACGACFENPHCNANEVCLSPGAIPFGGCCGCATVTPAVTPCEEYEEEHLEFDFSIAPLSPRVGDDVTLTFHVRNTTSGLAGIPSYTLLMTPALFTGTTMAMTTGLTSLGSETVTYHRHAGQAGTTSMTLSVYYETARGCIGHPTFSFRSMNSPGYPVTVTGGACGGDCNSDGHVGIEELITLVNIALDTAPIADCIGADSNGDSAIQIDELVLAVAHALSGCTEARVRSRAR